MTRKEIANQYFDWMYDKVCGESYSKTVTYEKLFHTLNQRQFYYTIEMDGNRESDGISLRYKFGRECGIEQAIIASALDSKSCSVLEMMIALAIRCEDSIMDDDAYGDRTGQWFWLMIMNLGLSGESDSKFDLGRVNHIIDRFLDREYSRDGRGSLFYVENAPSDMRDMEIWYQMHLYLQEFSDDE